LQVPSTLGRWWLWQRKGEAGNADQNTILEHG